MEINLLPTTPSFVLNEINYQRDSIVSKIVLKSENVSVTVFAVSEGQGISAHKTTSYAIIHILEGVGSFMLVNKWHEFRENDYFFMKKGLLHAVKAKSDFKFLLYLFKN